MYVLKIAIGITLSLVLLMASACCGYFFFTTPSAKGFIVPTVLFFGLFLVLVREVWRSLMKGDT